MFKTRIRQDSKLNNKKFLLALCIIVLFLGTAYSSMSQVLTLGGIATIKGRGVDIGGDGYEDLGGGLAKGNVDAYISSVTSMWRAGTTWTAQINVVVENNNEFDTNNIEIILDWPGISSLVTYIGGATTSIDTANDLGTFKIENSSEGVIAKGNSKTYQLTVSFTNEFLEAVIDRLSPEELEQISDQDKSIIYGSAQGDISKNLREIIMDNITYNMAGTPSPNTVVVAAKTIFEPGFELENFSYVYGDLRFDVEFYEYIRQHDAVYVTTAKISVTNNNQNHTVTALRFQMNHNKEIAPGYTGKIVGNWASDGGGNSFSNPTNININESTGTYLVASIPSWGQIAPGQTRNFYISQILTNLKYRSFTFSDIVYSLDGVEYNPRMTMNMNFLMNNDNQDENLNVNNTINENTVSNEINNNTTVNTNTTNTVNTNTTNTTNTNNTTNTVDNTVTNENDTTNTVDKDKDSIVKNPEKVEPEEDKIIRDDQESVIDPEVSEDLFVSGPTDDIVDSQELTDETKDN